MDLKNKIINRKHKWLKTFFENELTTEEQNYLINKFKSTNIQEICYREIYNILEIPKCKYCGNSIPFQGFSKGYMVTCKNTKCQYLNRKDNMLLHYGVGNPYQLEYVKNKCKEKHIEKYGVDNVSKSDEIKKKKEETCLKHYGVTNQLKNEEIKNKVKNTCLQKYGETTPLKNEKIKNKIKNTCLEKYGVDNISKSDEIKKKKEETYLKHYGVTHYWKDPNNRKNFHTEEAHRKEYETKKKNGTFNSSSTEKLALSLLKSKFNNIQYQYKSKEYPFICDFYIPEINTYIEYNEHWTHGFKPFENTEEDLELLNKWKEKNTNYYKVAINTWTIRDVKKRNTAKQNNLNWIEFWNINELKNWLNTSIF